MKKPHRHKGISRHLNYTVDELSRLLRVSPITIRRWIKHGLPVLTDKRPLLILGSELLLFFEHKKPPKQVCKISECYCLRCRAPRLCGGGMADFIPMTPTNGNLRALCATCGTLMHKRITKSNLHALSEVLDISFLEANSCLTE